ncbi:MAG TPA: TetR/AcrR family transcriptional regulator [Caldilineaceae bacterium]|nr:TetR/AcrR family transcriptional regulator [Caldilineaceae bacterium]
MPKDTFFNLPPEKRELITRIAIEEFGNHEYGEVSISRIVARAGIAKGSFYQYFEDKEDLFRYLLDLIVEKKWEMFSLDHPDPRHLGVFQYLRWMAQAGLQFELAYPDFMRVGYRVLSRSADRQELFDRYRQQALTFYRRLVATGKAQGDIAPEIDEELAAFIFDAIFSMLGQFLMQRMAGRQGEWDGKQAMFEQPEVLRLFDQTIDILEHGLGAHDRNSLRGWRRRNEDETTRTPNWD